MYRCILQNKAGKLDEEKEEPTTFETVSKDGSPGWTTTDWSGFEPSTPKPPYFLSQLSSDQTGIVIFHKYNKIYLIYLSNKSYICKCNKNLRSF